MNFSTIKIWLAGLCVVALAGCGGGGGASGDSALGGGTGSGASPTVTLSLSSPTVTAAAPATVTVTVRDAAGNPMAGTVVDLSTERGTLATLSVASVATNASGVATAQLSIAAAGLSGADQVLAVAKLATTTVQGRVSFSVSGAQPTISLATLPPGTTLRVSTGAVTLQAVLKDAAGAGLANQAVQFVVAGKLIQLSAASALTDKDGVATTVLSAATATGNGVDTVTANATVAGNPVTGSLSVQVLADTPKMTILPAAGSSSNVSATAPSKLSILVQDAKGVGVVGTVVSLVSTFGLSAFDSTTVSTDSNGAATVVVSPKSGTSNGADQIVASTVVGGVAISAQLVVQVTSAGSSTVPPVLSTKLTDAAGAATTSISSATPATVTATLTDSKGVGVPGQVVTFSVVRKLAVTNVATALTGRGGQASVILSPSNSTSAGADEVTASVNIAGTTLLTSTGFQVQATNVTLSSFTSAVASLGAYGQTTLTVGIAGATVGSPVNISVNSSCVSLGKATLSPATFTATSASVALQFKDNGCGAVQASDKLQATIVGSASSVTLDLPIAVPSASSLAFVSAAPEIIYIKASGFTETSTLTFEVRDGAGNTLPNRNVILSLLTLSGGVTMEGGIADVTQVSDAAGRVTVRVNSGTVPTPIRVSAKLKDTPTIATVSSNLSVAVGLPSQLNFSMSQAAKNIEGFNIDGTINTYNIIASDRSGNPVPAGTSINFVTEGGQVEPIKQIQLVSGLARASAGFISADPRPADGRITVIAYALGEESFIDQNGNNIHDQGEPFQDLGNIFKDRIFDGLYDPSIDEYLPTNINNSSVCAAPNAQVAFNVATGLGRTAVTDALLALDPSIPSMSSTSTCDGLWSGAGKVYVRRAAETVMSTSTARVHWGSKVGLTGTCRALTLQTGPQPSTISVLTPVQGDETWYGSGATSLTLPFIVADSNTFTQFSGMSLIRLTDPTQLDFLAAKGRLNPMAAGTIISATATTGLKVLVAGTSVPSTTEATASGVGVTFDTASSGVVFVTFTSPSGVATTYAINVQQTSAGKPSSCP